MKPLTARQRQVWQLLQDYLAIHGRPPTRMELAQHLGFRSPNAAEQHLRALANKGWIALEPGINRNIRLLVETAPVEAGLPLIGRVSAGMPTVAEAHIEGYYSVDPELFRPRADYLLRVRGLSLRDAGILEGDWLAVHRTTEARSGQLVVVRLGDEVTAKRFYARQGRIRLCPENPAFAPIEIDPERQSFEIEGLVVGVIRIEPQ
ncbi:MAG: transcriptional repressor LexA [Candidatus Competibacteraceae bacterium]